MSETPWLDDILAELNDKIADQLQILHSEFPEYDFSPGVFYRNQRLATSLLDPPTSLLAYLHTYADGKAVLQFGNTQRFPVEVLEVRDEDRVVFSPTKAVRVPGRDRLGLVPFTSVELPTALGTESESPPKLMVYFRIAGTEKRRKRDVTAWSSMDLGNLQNDIARRPANVETFDFLVVNKDAKRIVIKPGQWTIDRMLIVPKGYTLVAGPGVRFDLSNGAMILSRSPVQFVGTAGEPVVVQSNAKDGQGFIVINAGGQSRLEHVLFENLGNPSVGGWSVTGAVTFYESDVDVISTSFVANRCEDAFNTVRGSFTIDHSAFIRTQADAFDADFCKGSVTNTVFRDIGNDAIDVSGTSIDIEKVTITVAGDKGLSAGERSEMVANQVTMVDNAIAVASKDTSTITLTNSSITGAQIGLTAYQKKPEFGPASIDATNLRVSKYERRYLVEKGSDVRIDGVPIPPSHENVKELLYGAQYGMASRR